VTMFHHLEDRPDFGPLHSRGWAFQERHLARRIVFFMGGGMTWMCKESEHNEMGIDREIRSFVTLFDRASTGEWLNFLHSYSFSRLSFQKDRLPAIAGIANEIGKKRRDKYHLGVWENDIEKQLIWRPQSLKHHPENERKDQKDLPSWCWASLGGGTRFLVDWLPSPSSSRHSWFAESEAVASALLNRQANSLLVRGVISHALVRLSMEGISPCCFIPLTNSRELRTNSLERSFLGIGLVGAPVFELLSGGAESRVVGIAAFDRAQYSTVIVLPLVRSFRKEGDLWYVTFAVLAYALANEGQQLR
jgi:hypothetical protein